jgi:transposase InsO family protein
VDYYSKFPIARKLPVPAPSTVVIDYLKCVFSEFGIPERIVTDNGPHFISEHFKKFASDWNFDHVTTSPRRAQGNGFVERNVQTIKNIIQKAQESKTDPILALLHWRTVPICATIPSPAKLLMSRRLRTTLLTSISNADRNRDEIQEQFMQRQISQKTQFDRHARKTEYPPLYPGQHVRVQHHVTGYWNPAVVVSRLDDPRS